jgi:N-acetylneuraminic acid mutarotase
MGNTWTPKATFPGGGISGLYFATGFAINTKGYICCGKIGPNNYTSELWEYEQSLDQWVQLSDFPGGVRYQLASFVIDSKAYVGLGTDQDIYRKDIWEFDAAVNSWSAKSDFPSSERASTMTFTLGQRGYVCMGGNGGLLGDLWQYNPFSDGWYAKASYGGSSRKNGVSFVMNGKAYVGIGKGYSGKKASMHEYTPNSSLGINEMELAITVYPNPSNDYINLSYENSNVQSFELYSMVGRKLFAEDHVKQIDIRNYEAGSYILIAKQTNGTIVAQQTIIIQ